LKIDVKERRPPIKQVYSRKHMKGAEDDTHVEL